MTDLEVRERLAQGEDSRTQFKCGPVGIAHLSEELVAFANAQGGVIFLGVDDEGTPVGLSRPQKKTLVNAMTLQLGKSALLGKGVKEAFIWCLNEEMNNVLTHSSLEGCAHGYVMAVVAPEAKRIKVCVFDLGIGMKASFAGTQYATEDDYVAITTAMKVNVTSGIGQGNGLWGLHELMRRAEDGSVSIASGEAAYLFSPNDGVDGQVEHVPLSGFDDTTLVDFRMTLGGTILRTLAENAIENDGKTVTLDFDGVTFCSSAFVDELVGKLMARYGFPEFTQKGRLVNVRGLSAQLVNHSIAQRLAAEAKGEA